MAKLSAEILFGDGTLTWGRKHPRGTPLADVWKRDRDYLVWSANLVEGRPSDLAIPPAVRHQIAIALRLAQSKHAEAEAMFDQYEKWEALSQQGIGLSDLPRPGREECRRLIAGATMLGGHSDLDGIYSLAALLACGGALGFSNETSSPKEKPRGEKIRLLGYAIRSREDYDTTLNLSSRGGTAEAEAEKDDSIVIVDFAAHPKAVLNLDHHATTLSFWELGTPVPAGVYETTMPSCPRLLASFCGLEIPSEILSGCDMIDGALYTSIDDTTDLKNPFVALNYCFSVEASDVVLRQAVLTLAGHQLNPDSLLTQPIWKARLKLIELELEEQRVYWRKKSRFRVDHPVAAIADGRGAPYSTSNFRYLPFEDDGVNSKPYLITLRPPNMFNKINIGISRNPFYANPELFSSHPINLGALARSLGQGGGRIEASSVTVPTAELTGTVNTILVELEQAAPAPGFK